MFEIINKYLLDSFDETALKNDLATSFLYTGFPSDLTPEIVEANERLKDNNNYYIVKNAFVDALRASKSAEK